MDDPRQRWADARRAARRARRRALYRKGLRQAALAAWNISKAHNVGSLVRTAHAAALREVILVGERDWNREAARTADLYTTVTQLPADPAVFLDHVRSRGYTLVAVELAPGAVNLFEADYPENPCFLLGAELGGVPEPLLEAARLVVRIPQWGLVPCLNVAVAGSIVVYDHLAKLHRRGVLDRPDGGLPEPGEEPSSG